MMNFCQHARPRDTVSVLLCIKYIKPDTEADEASLTTPPHDLSKVKNIFDPHI